MLTSSSSWSSCVQAVEEGDGRPLEPVEDSEQEETEESQNAASSPRLGYEASTLKPGESAGAQHHGELADVGLVRHLVVCPRAMIGAWPLHLALATHEGLACLRGYAQVPKAV